MTLIFVSLTTYVQCVKDFILNVAWLLGLFRTEVPTLSGSQVNLFTVLQKKLQ